MEGGDHMLSEKALRRACHHINPAISVHGMWSTFHDWVADNTKFAVSWPNYPRSHHQGLRRGCLPARSCPLKAPPHDGRVEPIAPHGRGIWPLAPLWSPHQCRHLKDASSINVRDLTGITHIPPMRASGQLMAQIRHRNVLDRAA